MTEPWRFARSARLQRAQEVSHCVPRPSTLALVKVPAQDVSARWAYYIRLSTGTSVGFSMTVLGSRGRLALVLTDFMPVPEPTEYVTSTGLKVPLAVVLEVIVFTLR